MDTSESGYSSSGSSSSESSSSSDDAKLTASTVWAKMTKKPKAECECGLIPCLCTTTNEEAQNVVEVGAPSLVNRLVLNPDAEEAEQVLLDEIVATKLKPHQIDGVRFLWARAMATPPRGAILADHMGLGKTLQLVSVLAGYFAPLSLTRRTKASTRRALVIAPAFVLSNWEAEILKWAPRRIDAKKDDAPVFATVLKARRLPPNGTRAAKLTVLKTWHEEGGTLLMGYEMFRQLAASTIHKKTAEMAELRSILCDPGPGFVILDEAHRLKEPKSQLYGALELLATKRRILASGYPIQNRLDEYWALVAFARPDALGPYDQFRHFFEKPIHRYVEARTIDEESTAGPQEKDAKMALQRAYVLQYELRDVVLRRGQDELGSELPPRTDWLIHCRLSGTQDRLYRAFIDQDTSSAMGPGTAGGELAAYHTTLAIVNHPDIIHTALLDEEKAFDDDDDVAPPHTEEEEKITSQPPMDDEWSAPEVVAAQQKARDEKRARDEAKREKLRKKVAARFAAGFSKQNEDDSDDAEERMAAAILARASGLTELATWARPVLRPLSKTPGDGGYLTGQADGPCGSGKAAVAVSLIAAARKRGERVVVFTQTLGTLDVLERLLDGVRVARIDGATPTARRAAIVAGFNPPIANKRPSKKPRLVEDACDVLLMSIKAGGEGINLVGASRVILFDVCWNPCFDQQALSRAHRFGQSKHVHVYRLVGPEGTMEDRVLRQQRRKELLVKQVGSGDTEMKKSCHNRTRLKRVFTGNEAVDDDLLQDVIANLGGRTWIAAVHQSTSSEDDDEAEVLPFRLSDDDKALALHDYATFKASHTNDLVSPS